MRHPRLAAVPLVVLVALLTTSCSSQQDAPAAATSTASAGTPTPTAAPTVAPTPTSTPAPTPAPTPAGTSSTTAAAAGPVLTISGFAYDVPTSVRPGEQVTVVNRDREAHTVTVDGGAVRLSVLPGATAVFAAPTTVGAHPVTCDLHGGMDAVLAVA